MTSLDLDVALRAYIPSWEHVGTGLDTPITLTNITAARTATGLDWEPQVEPQFRRVHVATVGDEPLHEYQEPKDSTGRQQFKYVTKGHGGPILDSANGTYPLFGNGEMFAIAETIGRAGLEMGHDVRFVAGGEVAGGKRVFLMADLGARMLAGDPSPHVRYLGLVSSHDSTAALKVIGTDLRWYCTNAIKASEIDASSKGTAFTFRHSTRMRDRIEDAKTAITTALFQLGTVEKVTTELLSVPTTQVQRETYLREFAISRIITKADARRHDAAEASHQRATALGNTVGTLNQILGSRTCEGINGTAYGLLAATVEFLDHHRPSKTPAGLFGRTVLETERGKVLALDILRQTLAHH